MPTDEYGDIIEEDGELPINALGEEMLSYPITTEGELFENILPTPAQEEPQGTPVLVQAPVCESEYECMDASAYSWISIHIDVDTASSEFYVEEISTASGVLIKPLPAMSEFGERKRIQHDDIIEANIDPIEKIFIDNIR